VNASYEKGICWERPELHYPMLLHMVVQVPFWSSKCHTWVLIFCNSKELLNTAILLRQNSPSGCHWLIRLYIPWNANKWPGTWYGSSRVKWPPAKNNCSPRILMSLEKSTEQIVFNLERFRIWICVRHVARYVLLPFPLSVSILICFWTPYRQFHVVLWFRKMKKSPFPY
jgi:hypothetical protein